MPAEDMLGELAKRLAGSGILVAADVDASSFGNTDMEIVAARIIERHKRESGICVVNSQEIRDICGEIAIEKAPVAIEVSRKSDFRPAAADVDADYLIKNKGLERVEGTVNDFVSHYNDRMAKIRDMIDARRGSLSGIVERLESLKSYANGRDVTVVGMVSKRIMTKNGNLMVVIEDETSETKIIFMNRAPRDKALFESARCIIDDEVLAVRGKIASPFVIASGIVWPDVPVRIRKSIPDDLGIAFLSDVHVGSKKFKEKNFSRFIKWLNGGIDDRKDLAGKIKYIVMAGDLADGIGVYPNHDKDLQILDVYMQYKVMFNFIKAIPDYIHVFMIPGNHDAVQRAEPQPEFGPEILGDFMQDNVHLLPNPSYLTLHGIDIMAYHGTSLDSIIRSVPAMSYAEPARAMVELLKRRHLSPIHGGNIIVPSKTDTMVIDKVPDILHMGHIHKNGYESYHGVEIINSGTWQSRTSYQVAQGHIPTPCVLPVFETKKWAFSAVDFNSG